MSRFHIGQRVRKTANREAAHRNLVRRLHAISNGAIGTVVSELDGVTGQYLVRFDHYPLRLWMMPYQISPLDDGYDGRELASWATCPWRPERESAQKGAM